MKKTSVYKVCFVCSFVLAIVVLYSFALADHITENSILNRSDSLSIITTTEGNTTRFDYVDEEGRITYAADKRYATKKQTNIDGSILEEYYDAEGLPVKQKMGHYALMKYYNENNQIRRLVYLDLDGQIMMNYDGYAIVNRIYNDKGSLDTEIYFDNCDKPVATHSFGYGCKRIYDEAGNIKTYMFIDNNGKIAKTEKGYAIIHRTYYSEGINKGRIKNEYYCDETDNPIQLVKGQYGIHKEYDEYGRANQITYLNNNGEAIISSDGYATYKQTFYADDTIHTEAYFDEKGDPIALSEGQYGVLYQDDKIMYLDVNGSELFSFRNLLHNNHLLMIALGLAAIIIPAISNKKVNRLLLVIYLFLIIYLTIMFRNHLDRKLELRLFWSYKQFFSNNQIRWQIIKNIYLFIPLGIILYVLYPNKKTMLLLAAISITIEMIQYISGIGLCEIDDIISNTLGGYIGYIIGKLTEDNQLRINSRKHIHIMKRR